MLACIRHYVLGNPFRQKTQGADSSEMEEFGGEHRTDPVGKRLRWLHIQLQVLSRCMRSMPSFGPGIVQSGIMHDVSPVGAAPAVYRDKYACIGVGVASSPSPTS
jgi:hypothetical protein